MMGLFIIWLIHYTPPTQTCPKCVLIIPAMQKSKGTKYSTCTLVSWLWPCCWMASSCWKWNLKNNLLSVVQKRNAKGTLVFNFVFKSKRRKTQNIDNHTLYFSISAENKNYRKMIFKTDQNKIQKIKNKIKRINYGKPFRQFSSKSKKRQNIRKTQKLFQTKQHKQKRKPIEKWNPEQKNKCVFIYSKNVQNKNLQKQIKYSFKNYSRPLSMFTGIENDTSYSTPAQQAKGQLTNLEKKMSQITPPGWHAKRLTPPPGLESMPKKEYSKFIQIQYSRMWDTLWNIFFSGWVMWM